MVKNPPQCGRPLFDPLLGRFPGEGNGYPFQYSCLEDWTEAPGGLQSKGSQRVGHNWATFSFFLSFFLSLGCYRADNRMDILPIWGQGTGHFRSWGLWQQLLWGLVNSRDFYPGTLIQGSTVRMLLSSPMVMMSVFESELECILCHSNSFLKNTCTQNNVWPDTWELRDPVRLRHKTNHLRDKNQFPLEWL